MSAEMTDVHDSTTRSYNMSRIGAKDTKPELMVRKFLHAKGFRYRLNDKKLPGKPDIVLPKHHTVIFIHGCFWHGHENCHYFVVPKTRTDWWMDKIGQTKQRDALTQNELLQKGWKVIVVWECQLKSGKATQTLSQLISEILS